MTDPRSVLAEALQLNQDRTYVDVDNHRHHCGGTCAGSIERILSERGYTIVASDRLAGLKELTAAATAASERNLSVAEHNKRLVALQDAALHTRPQLGRLDEYAGAAADASRSRDAEPIARAALAAVGSVPVLVPGVPQREPVETVYSGQGAVTDLSRSEATEKGAK